MTNKAGTFRKNASPAIFNNHISMYAEEDDVYLKQMPVLNETSSQDDVELPKSHLKQMLI